MYILLTAEIHVTLKNNCCGKYTDDTNASHAEYMTGEHAHRLTTQLHSTIYAVHAVLFVHAMLL